MSADDITLGGVALPPGLQWADEFAWTPVEQAAPVYSLSGALVIQYGTRLSGRPVTLQGGADSDPVSRQTLASLRALLDQQTLTLRLRGTDYTVAWRHEERPVEAVPALPLHPVSNDDLFVSVVLRLRIL